MKQTIKIGKIRILPLLKYSLLVNTALAIIFCIMRLFSKWDLIVNPPSVMIGSSNLNMSPWPYIIVPMILLWFINFVYLTILEVVVAGIYNLIAQRTGGIEVEIHLKDKEI